MICLVNKNLHQNWASKDGPNTKIKINIIKLNNTYINS